MAERYSTNAFANFSDIDNNGAQSIRALDAQPRTNEVTSGDNPDFLYPGKSLRNAPVGNSVKVQRGYMRMLSDGVKGGSALSKKRLHFQFNPDTLVRAVIARNDIQQWMNQDPLQLTQAIPGDANFSFELLFNREQEIVTSSYQAGLSVIKSTAPANLNLQTAGSEASQSVSIPHSAVTDIGVLSDLIVFDEIIGQGVNTSLINQVIKNAAALNAKKRRDYAATLDSSNNPTSFATATVTLNGNKIEKVKIDTGGSGYTSAPVVTLEGGGGGSGGSLEAIVLDGKVTEIKVLNEGSGYTAVPTVKFEGGGGGNSSSNSGKDAQDQDPGTFDEIAARTAMSSNFGNSAFLVSLPVRIVFSSLFMVEGFITSTQVTFNKFNPHMVPTQCVVGVTMQAMYIGFARKDTYLTLQLAAGMKAVDEELAKQAEKEAAEISATTELSKKMFVTTVNNDVHYESDLSPKSIFDDGDYTNSIAFQVQATGLLKNELKKGSIKSISQRGEWKITYKGNTAGDAAYTASLPAGGKKFDLDKVWVMSQESEFNTGDLKGDRDTIVLKYVLEYDRPEVLQYLDKTSTSRYLIDYEVKFKITTTSGQTVDAVQYAKMPTQEISFNNSLHFHDKGNITLDPNAKQTAADPKKGGVK
jgi:hypothetical protein